MWCDGLRSNSRQSRRQARVPGRCAVRCHSSLTARVRQNSPRTPLSASNRTTQRKADVRLVSSPRAGHCLTDSLKASTWPQRKNSGTSPAFALAYGRKEWPDVPRRRQASECPNRAGSKTQRQRPLNRQYHWHRAAEPQYSGRLLPLVA